MANPCSVPPWLRVFVKQETPEQQAACAAHDAAYRAGGDTRAKYIADAEFYLALLRTGMEPTAAHQYFQAVYMFGDLFWGKLAPRTWPDEKPEAP